LGTELGNSKDCIGIVGWLYDCGNFYAVYGFRHRSTECRVSWQVAGRVSRHSDCSWKDDRPRRTYWPRPLRRFVRSVFQGILGVVRGKSIILLDEDDLTSVLFRTLTLDRDSSGKRIYKEIADDIDEVRRSAHSAMVGRIYFRTKEGFIGLGPRGLEVDNWVALIPGCHVPIILRKSAFLQGKIQIKCDHHEQVETCSSMGCAKTAALLHERFEVVGEACKYHSIKF
jgi:hypothetical protein